MSSKKKKKEFLKTQLAGGKVRARPLAQTIILPHPHPYPKLHHPWVPLQVVRIPMNLLELHRGLTL